MLKNASSRPGNTVKHGRRPPLFLRKIGGHRRIGVTQVLQATLDGLTMAAQEAGQVDHAAVPEFKGFGRGEKATLTLVE